uniref:Uncharacterized protein n=1 Tax=Human herpesvirus 1 TaxID=10298 RepID=A0A2Z4HEW1_HHV1|nr:hypothetical protein [Human alphaherpesvirus 1]
MNKPPRTSRTQGCGWLIGICPVWVVPHPLAFGRLRIMAVFYADIGFLPRNKTRCDKICL